MGIGFSPKVKQQARYLRHQLRRAGVLLRERRSNLAGLPVLFANSFPKSGTHLLSQILDGFTRLGPAVKSGLPVIAMYDNQTGRLRPVQELMADLRRLQPGDIGYGHLHALPELTQWLSQDGYATFFILRDPRDVVVSHVHYVTELEPDHFHHRYYSQQLTSFDERLRTSILGLPDSPAPFPDIRGRFAPFMGWLDLPQVLCLHYEQLIHARETELRRILRFAQERGFRLQVGEEQAVRLLIDAINPQLSPTFRSGKTGGWREHFSAEHKALFKEVTGDLLIQLGYEQNYDW